MTREENIATLNEHLEHWKRLLSEKICDQSEGEKTIDALQNAIKALEQEPTRPIGKCDFINRQMATAQCFQAMTIISNEFGQELSQDDESYNAGLRKAVEIIRALPSVTPQPKFGYISIDDAMSAFDDFMCNDIEPEGQEVFLELLKDRAERAKNDLDRNRM